MGSSGKHSEATREAQIDAIVPSHFGSKCREQIFVTWIDKRCQMNQGSIRCPLHNESNLAGETSLSYSRVFLVCPR